MPLGLIKAPSVALRMPTSKEPAVRLACAPETTMLRLSPLFWNPKSPDNWTEPPMTARNPSTTTAMVRPGTSIAAVSAPTVSDCFTARSVEL